MSKNSSLRFDPINLPRRLREGLQEADDLLERGKSQQALELLSELDNSFPRQPDVLGLMANANLDMDNQHGYLHAIHKLHELTPNRADEATPFQWSIASDQAFSNLQEGSFLNVPIKDIPNPFRLFFDNVDIFTDTNIAVAVLSGICLSRPEPRLDTHSQPFFHPIKFHLGRPGTNRSDLGIEVFFCQQDFDLIVLDSFQNRQH